MMCKLPSVQLRQISTQTHVGSWKPIWRTAMIWTYRLTHRRRDIHPVDQSQQRDWKIHHSCNEHWRHPRLNEVRRCCGCYRLYERTKGSLPWLTSTWWNKYQGRSLLFGEIWILRQIINNTEAKLGLLERLNFSIATAGGWEGDLVNSQHRIATIFHRSFKSPRIKFYLRT